MRLNLRQLLVLLAAGLATITVVSGCGKGSSTDSSSSSFTFPVIKP